MHPNDEKRLAHERALFMAKRGSDYSRENESVRKAKAEHAKGRAAREAYLKQRRFGYLEAAASEGYKAPFKEH